MSIYSIVFTLEIFERKDKLGITGKHFLSVSGSDSGLIKKTISSFLELTFSKQNIVNTKLC